MYAFDFPLDLQGGYNIIKSNFRKECGNQFYDIYHTIICQQIEENNIKGVNGLIRWIDVIGYFPNNKLLFEHALSHGSFEMFMMIYYICLFWNNEGEDDQLYLNGNQHQIDPLKSEFIENMIKNNGKLFLGMDKIAELACDDDVDELYEKEYGKYMTIINNILMAYNIDMDQINTEFYDTQGDRYNELSS